MEVSKERFEEIAKAIGSEQSPVGIDAKTTHVIIIDKLMKIEERLTQIEKSLAAAKTPQP